jgi:hypothetical protein
MTSIEEILIQLDSTLQSFTYEYSTLACSYDNSIITSNLTRKSAKNRDRSSLGQPALVTS